MTKEEAVEKLEDIQAGLNTPGHYLFPDEVVTKIYEVLAEYDFKLNFKFEYELDLISEEVVRYQLEMMINDLNDEIFVERISRYIGQISKSGDYYKKNPYGYLENITRDDSNYYLKRAIEMVLEN